MSDYDFQTIETRWQKRWAEEGAFEVTEDPKKPKFYCLEMLPYPSGDIHVGHVRNYCITDVISRCKTMRGFNVMHPIGWDALGLPAENAAIKRGIHPEKWTRQNIAGMKRQLQRLGFSYPWSREIATCDAEYYRWNQWMFLRMLERGIAYRAKAPVNWCPSCLTVLANEQAEGGICWRCKHQVEQRDMEQWFLRITAYQDQLLEDMAQLAAWPERVLVQQKNWVGKSPGAEMDFPVEGFAPIRVFTTRVDTTCGATFMVLAPEHPMVDELLAGLPDAAARKDEIARLRGQDRRARLEGRVEKEGVFTGRHATNPFTGEKIPVWAGNFVLMGYGTGAIMSVPAHDQRDFEFARKYGIEVRVVIQPDGPKLDGATMEAAYDGPGRVVNSGEFDGLASDEAIARMAAHAEAKGFGKATVTYRLKDWLISRQRYWGTPIPVVYCEKDGMQPVPDAQLPVVLPPDAPFTGEGGNPLEKVPGVRERHLPEVRGEGAPRDGHHGHVRGLVLVLLPVPLAEEGRRALRPRRGRVLVPDRPLRRGDRARHPPPRLRALLDEGDARPRPRGARRAGDAPLPPGDGPQGRRGDVEVEGQHHRPRRRDRALRGRHPAALHPVRGAAGARDGVERDGHRGPAPLPDARLAPRGPPRRGPREGAPRSRCPTTCPRRRRTCGARCTRRSTRSRATSRSASSSTPRWPRSWSS